MIIKASELNSEVDFVPTIVFAFYCEEKRGDFVQTAEVLKERFGEIPLVACSSSGNSIASAPYRTDETVLCLMDLERGAFSFYFTDDQQCQIGPLSELEAERRDALLFYAGSGSWIQEGLRGVQEQLSGGTLLGAISGGFKGSERGSIYHEGSFYEEGIIGCLIDASKYEIKGAALHDFEPAGIDLFVTEAKGNEIIQIEDEPAMSMIERIIGMITPKRLAMFDTPFFIKNFMKDERVECSLMSLQDIDRKRDRLYLFHDIQAGATLKVAIPISNRTMKRRLWKTQKRVRPAEKSGAVMFFLSSSSLPSHWHEMEVLYMMNIIDQIDIPFMGLHTSGEIAPLADEEHSILRDQTLTVITISERSFR